MAYHLLLTPYSSSHDPGRQGPPEEDHVVAIEHRDVEQFFHQESRQGRQRNPLDPFAQGRGILSETLDDEVNDAAQKRQESDQAGQAPTDQVVN